MLWRDLNITFDLGVVTLTLKYCPGDVLKIVKWQVRCLEGVDVQHSGVTFYLDSARTFSTAKIETYFTYHKAIWIAAAKYFIYFYPSVLSQLTAILTFLSTSLQILISKLNFY